MCGVLAIFEASGNKNRAGTAPRRLKVHFDTDTHIRIGRRRAMRRGKL